MVAESAEQNHKFVRAVGVDSVSEVDMEAKAELPCHALPQAHLET